MRAQPFGRPSYLLTPEQIRDRRRDVFPGTSARARQVREARRRPWGALPVAAAPTQGASGAPEDQS